MSTFGPELNIKMHTDLQAVFLNSPFKGVHDLPANEDAQVN